MHPTCGDDDITFSCCWGSHRCILYRPDTFINNVDNTQWGRERGQEAGGGEDGEVFKYFIRQQLLVFRTVISRVYRTSCLQGVHQIKHLANGLAHPRSKPITYSKRFLTLWWLVYAYKNIPDACFVILNAGCAFPCEEQGWRLWSCWPSGISRGVTDPYTSRPGGVSGYPRVWYIYMSESWVRTPPSACSYRFVGTFLVDKLTCGNRESVS